MVILVKVEYHGQVWYDKREMAVEAAKSYPRVQTLHREETRRRDTSEGNRS